MNRQPAKNRERGSAMVETALVFTTFAFLVIGAFDFGQFLFVHQALMERARNAARWGAVHDPADTTSVQNMVLYNQPTASDDGSTYFGLTSTMVQVSNPGSGTADNRLTVLITNYPYTILSPLIHGSYTGPNIMVSVPLGQ